MKMEILTPMILMSSVILSIKNFSKKILFLLTLEMVMITSIFFMILSKTHQDFSPILILIFSVMMVLDSTMGISSLMSSSRNSMMIQKKFSSF